MELWETVLCGVGLAADAVAVSAVKGMENRRSPFRSAVLCGLWFGAFQALMTALGALLGDRFRTVILQIDHWLSFAVLCFIGVRMILDAFSPDTRSDGSLAPVSMAASAFATSVDAAGHLPPMCIPAKPKIAAKRKGTIRVHASDLLRAPLHFHKDAWHRELHTEHPHKDAPHGEHHR